MPKVSLYLGIKSLKNNVKVTINYLYTVGSGPVLGVLYSTVFSFVSIDILSKIGACYTYLFPINMICRKFSFYIDCKGGGATLLQHYICIQQIRAGFDPESL